ncbi:MAG: MBL fold metallo-hydrolase [Candidatus Aminicenantes bacterium]|nr:MBL fold metallo-hydrolase [Candidatus Aminicenantes bacterium]
MNPNTELIRDFFEDIGMFLKETMGTTRLQYYIAKECLNLLEMKNKYRIGDMTTSPYYAPLNSSFYYLWQTSRFEEAEKIFLTGFCNKSPEKLISNYLLKYDSTKKTDNDFKLTTEIDLMVTFLAQLGFEDKILELQLDSKMDRNFSNHINSSWVKVLNRFLDSTTSKECYSLFCDLNIYSNKLSINERNISSNKTTITFGRWLLKRQLLAVYSVILADLYTPGFFNSLEMKKCNALDDIKNLITRTYESYIRLLYLSFEYYITVAMTSLNAIKGTNLYYDGKELKENIFCQIKYIKYRYADVSDFFSTAIFIKPDTILADFYKKTGKLSELLKTKPNGAEDTSIEAIIKLVTDVKTELNRLKEEYNCSKEVESLRIDIMKRFEAESFWEFCRKRFNKERLKVLATSLGNKYSTGTADFFKTPTLKLDKGKRIPTELCLLRKWGSTASIFENNKNFYSSFGGGHFIFHNGFGLAIDPGPDFLKNLVRHTDFDISDINGVVCTHTHYDHFADLQRIILGIREYNQYAGYKRFYYLLPDEDDQWMYPEKLREDFCINVFGGPSGVINSKKGYYLPNTDWGMKNGFVIQPIEVTHEIYRDSRFTSKNKYPEEVLEEYRRLDRYLGFKRISSEKKENDFGKRFWSYGLLIMPMRNGEPITKILFTGDAEYEKDLFSGLEPDLVILNSSSVRLKDIAATDSSRPQVLPQYVKANQLGYSGILSTLMQLKECKLAVVSDFFEGQAEADCRLFITEALGKDILKSNGTIKKILAGETGIRVQWDEKNELHVYCSSVCNKNNGGFVKLNENINQRRRGIFDRRENIQMVCKNCESIKTEIFNF